jgi:heme exporter protein A
MIEVCGLAKYFGRFTALRNLDLTVAGGEFIALFGRNGAGKTTFLRILAGLSRPSSGRTRIQSPDATSPQSLRAMLGYLSHNTSLYMDLTALENLRFYARLMDLSAADEDLEKEIARVGLSGRGHEPVRNYSRGMLPSCCWMNRSQVWTGRERPFSKNTWRRHMIAGKHA